MPPAEVSLIYEISSRSKRKHIGATVSYQHYHAISYKMFTIRQKKNCCIGVTRPTLKKAPTLSLFVWGFFGAWSHANWTTGIISVFTFFHGHLRRDTEISITYSKNKPGHKIDVFMFYVVCFTL